MTDALSRPQKLDALTSLRFFAAAMIVIGHAHPLFGSLGIATAVPLNQGVSFFFVLSGFILAYNYPSLEGAKAVRQFWLARFARVWPLHIVMLMLWIFLISINEKKIDFFNIKELIHLGVNVVLFQAWIPLHAWVLSFNGVAWSLSAELFFYAAFPFLIYYWSKAWHWIILVQMIVVILVVGLCSVLAIPGEEAYAGVGLSGLIYFNPIVRILEFSIGICAAFVVKKVANQNLLLSRSQWFLIELVALGCCIFALSVAANLAGIDRVFGRVTAYYFAHQGLWLVFAALIAVFSLSQGPFSKFLAIRPLVFLGEISFALYLCHALVIHYIQPYEVTLREAGGVAYAFFWVVLLLFSTILFYGVEKPARVTILQWGREPTLHKRNADFFLRSWGSWVQPTVALLALLSVAVCATVFRPSMIEPIDQANVSRFLHERGTYQIAGGATFDKRYHVVAYRTQAVAGDNVELQLLMRAEQDFIANDVVALHLNDEKGAMFAAPGDVVVDKAATKTGAGTYWIQRFTTTRALYDQTKSLGMAMYKNSAVLFEVSGGESDWNGRRLVLPMVSVGPAVASPP